MNFIMQTGKSGEISATISTRKLCFWVFNFGILPLICLDQILQSVGITACGQVLLSFDLFSSGIQMQREDNGMQMECSVLVCFDIS